MQLKKLEWQRLYPVKKLLFLGAWLFCVFIFVAAIILLVRDGNRENLWLGILCGIAAFVMSCPMIKYIRISYHCEYSCAVTPQVRQTGNRLSGLAGTAYASLLA